ncbi:sugar MFS transporter [Arcicella lustrica]|uniref:Sugar MFS transporter n=1 Tax=Arcicella lustrica TaxID=2984196 RepID=A0ABU5SQZ0_9BACT|nr:sugar MFS transporter [Arcicella sp. DC25W]MEA5429324.1 sugar MFS transporter [Arcicella sp. DC25W]
MTKSKSFFSPIVIIGMLFFIFGFITWLNGTLIPFLKIACELEYAQALLVTFAFYIAYVFLAIPSSMILTKVGFKNGMAWGLVVMAIGAIIFVPAAQSRSFALFLTGLFIQGAGISLLQTASNPYISILGPIESAAQRISIMGVCNKIAGALSPLILGAIILDGASDIETQLKTSLAAEKEVLLNELAGRVIVPYIVMAIALVLLAFLIYKSSLPEIDTSKEETDTASEVGEKSVLQHANLVFGILAIFCCVGVEVIAGDTIGQYGSSLGISLDVSKNFTSLTLIAMLVGYFVGIVAIPKFISQNKALMYCGIIGSIFTLGIVFTAGFTSVAFVAMLGLANALMWPAIFPLAIKGLGKKTEFGSALLIMGIGGGAILPYFYGKLAESFGIQEAYLILIPCYLYILFFATIGHKKQSW